MNKIVGLLGIFVANIALSQNIPLNTYISTPNEEKNILEFKNGQEVLSFNTNAIMSKGIWATNDHSYGVKLVLLDEQEDNLDKDQQAILKYKIKKIGEQELEKVYRISTSKRSVFATSGQLFVKIYALKLQDDQKVYWMARWCKVQDLDEGDLVAIFKDSTCLRWERISSKEQLDESGTFSVEVEGSHNLFLNGFLVHDSTR